MKKIILVSALASVFSITAHAQSTVTLYGIIDEAVQFNSNAKNTVGGVNVGGRQVTLDSTNGINGSRWGLKGAEDLGGGLLAVFTLESGLNLNTGAFGQGSTPFGRQAFVGLRSTHYGSLLLGRQYDLVNDYVQPVTALGYFGSTAFEHPGDLDNTNNSVRVNNAIKYASPNFNGLTFGAVLSLGGQAGNVTGSGGYSAGAAYANGPFALGVAYDYFKNPTGPFTTATPSTTSSASSGFFTDNVSGSSALSGALNTGYLTANSYQVVAAGGTYAIGPALFGVSYSNVQYASITALAGATATFNDAEIAFKWTFAPTFFAGASYNYTKGNSVRNLAGVSIGDQHFNQIAVMADYFLSKRTDVYAEASFQKAAGTSSTGGAAVADIGNIGDSSNNRQALVRLALRHKF
jgi:predicted porin